MFTREYFNAFSRELERLDSLRRLFARVIARIEGHRAAGVELEEYDETYLARCRERHNAIENAIKQRHDMFSRIEGQYYPPVRGLFVTTTGQLNTVLMEGDRQFLV